MRWERWGGGGSRTGVAEEEAHDAVEQHDGRDEQVEHAPDLGGGDGEQLDHSELKNRTIIEKRRLRATRARSLFTSHGVRWLWPEGGLI